MESIINPYIYVGSIVRREEVVNLVSISLGIPKERLIKSGRIPILVDARLIIIHELKTRTNLSIQACLNLTGFNGKTSSYITLLTNYEDRYRYNIEFRNTLNKWRVYLSTLNINYETYKII